MTLEQAKKQFKLGTKVKYFPFATNSFFAEEVIASEPWELGHGEIVVKLQGKSGCYGIGHIQLLKEDNSS